MTVKEKKNVEKKSAYNVPRDEVQKLMFEFIDTLQKIKNMTDVTSVHIAELVDVFVVVKEDNVSLSEKIMEKFAEWEAQYKIFPELHIINKDEKFYIPSGSYAI